MGNQQIPGERKKLVIIGGSFGGLNCYKALFKHFDIKVIDVKDFFEEAPAMHYYYTGQLAHETISLPYANSILRDSIIHGKAVELQHNGVVVETTEGLKTVPFDYCLIVTGAMYPGNMRPGFHLNTLKEHRVKIKEFQDKVLGAKKVLVKGAGVVGVEVAAELAVIGKQVVLSCKGGVILPHFTQKVQGKARPCLIEHGVQIHDYSKSAPNEEEFDLVYTCTGNIFPTEDNILNKNFPDHRDEKGRVRVNSAFQVCDSNHKPLPNIFSIGDCCITAANEEKNISNLKTSIEIVTHNLKQVALKGDGANSRFKHFQTDPHKIKTMVLISLGRKSLLVLGNSTFRGEYLTKMKKTFGPKLLKEFMPKGKAKKAADRV